MKNLSVILHMPLLLHLLAGYKDPVQDLEFLGLDEATRKKEPGFLKHIEDH